MFLKIDRPCSTAATIVEKLSLANTISSSAQLRCDERIFPNIRQTQTMDHRTSLTPRAAEASLATSVPPMPMATPMSACFRAGASFTPSPVLSWQLASEHASHAPTYWGSRANKPKNKL